MEAKNLLSWPVLGSLFRNQLALNSIRIFLLIIFIYAILYGFVHPNKDNLFTTGLFWSLFWPFFMVVSLPTLGKIFCMICPHGYIVRIFTKIGLKKNLPKYLKNPLIGFGIVIVVYWITVYTFPSTFNKPLPTALLFSFYTFLAIAVSFVFSNGSYCKYFCPIGGINTAFSRTGFIWLSTKYKDCASCSKPECAFACPYKLNPSKFDQQNSMDSCTLCMECATACKSVTLEIRKWGYSLYNPMKKLVRYEVWIYVILIGVISITMKFHHGLSRTGIGDLMPWNMMGSYIKNSFYLPNWIDVSGFIALLMGTSISVLLAVLGGYFTSKILNKSFEDVFYNVGYAFAPIMIVGGLSHALSFFFIEYYHSFVNGIAQAFFLNIHVEPLASRKDAWLRIFSLFNYIAGFWALYLVYRRIKLYPGLSKSKIAMATFTFSFLIIFYIALSVFQMYAMMVYPPNSHHHH